jgi:hypothetical protein
MWHESDDDPLTVFKPGKRGSTLRLGIDWDWIPGWTKAGLDYGAQEFLDGLVCSVYPFAAEHSPSARMQGGAASTPPENREFWLTVVFERGTNGGWLWLSKHRPRVDLDDRDLRGDDRNLWYTEDFISPLAQLNVAGVLELVDVNPPSKVYAFTQAFVDVLQDWWNREIVKRPE